MTWLIALCGKTDIKMVDLVVLVISKLAFYISKTHLA